MSTQSADGAPGTRYATLGTPIGIMVHRALAGVAATTGAGRAHTNALPPRVADSDAAPTGGKAPIKAAIVGVGGGIARARR